MAKKRRKDEVQYKWMTTTMRWYLQDMSFGDGETYANRVVVWRYEACDCPDFVKPGNYEMGTQGYKKIKEHMLKNAYPNTCEKYLYYNIENTHTGVLHEDGGDLTDREFHNLVGHTEPHDIEYDVFD